MSERPLVRYPRTKITLELSDLVLEKPKNRLRLTRTFSFRHPDYGLIADTVTRCLVMRSRQDGKLMFVPPARRGPGGIWISDYTVNFGLVQWVLAMLEESGWGERIEPEIIERLRERHGQPEMINDMGLPRVLQAESKDDEEEDEDG